jgi:hypothetical protein
MLIRKSFPQMTAQDSGADIPLPRFESGIFYFPLASLPGPAEGRKLEDTICDLER